MMGLLRHCDWGNPQPPDRPHLPLLSHPFTLDFIITGESLERLRDEVLVFVKAFLAQRGLSLSEEKTRITHIREGFDFLGQNVRKYGKQGAEKLIIKPAKQAVKHVLSKAKEIVKENRSSKPGNVIRRLNPVLRGWVNYHRHVCSKKVFSQIDWKVGGMILKWAKWRHPNKSMQWIQRKYFTSKGGDNWMFFGKDEQGKEQDVFKIGKVPIQRHVKVQGNANPYDPAMELYFEQRLAKKWETGCHGKRKVLSLWQRLRKEMSKLWSSDLTGNGNTHPSYHPPCDGRPGYNG